MASEMAAQIGRRIRELREAKGWNQRQLAEALELQSVTNQTVSVWERGVNKPQDDTMKLLAAVLGVGVGDFYAAPAEPTTEDFAKLNGKSMPSDIDTLTELLTDALDRLDAMDKRLKLAATERADMREQIDLLVARSEGRASGAQ